MTPALAAVIAAAASLMERDDFWRNAGTLPGEYDNLRDALIAAGWRPPQPKEEGVAP